MDAGASAPDSGSLPGRGGRTGSVSWGGMSARKIAAVFRGLELATRPIHPESREALDRRWSGLPEQVKTPAQLLGRAAVGCEGTHGVFPKCNLTCTPCYHSADANKVPIDGGHTVTAVKDQLAFLRRLRGPRAHAQLIGGEVSLLPAQEHAAALQAMRAAGREPMSMTHGDFDYQYLLDVALDHTGKSRFGRVSFAGHFDSLMRGRRGAPRPRTEEELNPFRERFAAMFTDLRRDHGVRSYIAHNMTVTPANVDQVARVTAAVLNMPFDMLSFQPAAYIGDARRWGKAYSDVSIDAVWDRIEAGAGQPIPWQGAQFGDPRCNRSAVVLRTGETMAPLLDPADPKDVAARDRLLAHFGGMFFGGTPRWIVALKVIRALLAHSRDVPVILGFGFRVAKRAGGLRHIFAAARAGKLSFRTFVVHNFMDAADVAPAWELMEKGVVGEDPKTREVQERLGACMYTMSHPDTGHLVPACVQHSVLDPAENAGLRKLLPLTPKVRTEQ